MTDHDPSRQKSVGAEGPSHRGIPHDKSTTPADIKVKLEEQRVLIEWQDGLRSDFDLALLRRKCPCAACRNKQPQSSGNPLQVLSFDPTQLRVVSAKLVGTYAIQFTWSDGHDTGIFDFRYLRSLE